MYSASIGQTVAVIIVARRDLKRDCNPNPDWRAALRRLVGAYADNTLRAYQFDFGIFAEWCQSAGLEMLPADPKTIAAFIADDAQRSAPATLRRRLAAIRKVHRLLRLPSPVEDEEVNLAMRRAMRSKPRRQKQAKGLTADLRDRLMAACPDTLTGLRNRAIIAVGYDTLCRRAELVALRHEDMKPHPNGGCSILIRRAKNDPFGDGRIAYLTPAATETLQRWLSAANIEGGWLFRPTRGQHILNEAPHPFTVNRVLKSAALAAGCPDNVVADISGHSMRVGAAQDMMTSGLGILPIMRAGGWKSLNVVGRYVQNAEIMAIGLERDRLG